MNCHSPRESALVKLNGSISVEKTLAKRSPSKITF